MIKKRERACPNEDFALLDGTPMDKKYYSGLIEKGLAFNAPEGMYKTE